MRLIVCTATIAARDSELLRGHNDDLLANVDLLWRSVIVRDEAGVAGAARACMRRPMMEFFALPAATS